jgi:hypothetical protein
MAAPAEQYHHHPLPSIPSETHQLHRRPVHPQQQQQQQPLQQPYHHYQPRSKQQQQQQHLHYQDQHEQPPHPPAHAKDRSLSFVSERSHKSSGSKDLHLQETHAEKESRRLHTKADPTLAMSEAEPCTFFLITTITSPRPLSLT